MDQDPALPGCGGLTPWLLGTGTGTEAQPCSRNVSKPSEVRGTGTGEPGTQKTSRVNVQDNVQEASTQGWRFTPVLSFAVSPAGHSAGLR